MENLEKRRELSSLGIVIRLEKSWNFVSQKNKEKKLGNMVPFIHKKKFNTEIGKKKYWKPWVCLNSQPYVFGTGRVYLISAEGLTLKFRRRVGLYIQLKDPP